MVDYVYDWWLHGKSEKEYGCSRQCLKVESDKNILYKKYNEKANYETKLRTEQGECHSLLCCLYAMREKKKTCQRSFA